MRRLWFVPFTLDRPFCFESSKNLRRYKIIAWHLRAGGAKSRTICVIALSDAAQVEVQGMSTTRGGAWRDPRPRASSKASRAKCEPKPPTKCVHCAMSNRFAMAVPAYACTHSHDSQTGNTETNHRPRAHQTAAQGHIKQQLTRAHQTAAHAHIK